MRVKQNVQSGAKGTATEGTASLNATNNLRSALGNCLQQEVQTDRFPRDVAHPAGTIILAEERPVLSEKGLPTGIVLVLISIGTIAGVACKEALTLMFDANVIKGIMAQVGTSVSAKALAFVQAIRAKAEAVRTPSEQHIIDRLAKYWNASATSAQREGRVITESDILKSFAQKLSDDVASASKYMALTEGGIGKPVPTAIRFKGYGLNTDVLTGKYAEAKKQDGATSITVNQPAPNPFR